MKKLVTISLFIFWAVVVAIIVAGLLFYHNNRTGLNNGFKLAFVNSGSINNNDLATSTQGTLTDAKGNPLTPLAAKSVGAISTLSLSEIAKHNSNGDCWLLINNNVYNVTSFLSAHPGGAGTIIPYCGREATQAFNTKDIGSSHSNTAISMLKDYYIGYLNEVFTAKTIPSTPAGQAGVGGATKAISGSSSSANTATKPVAAVSSPVAAVSSGGASSSSPTAATLTLSMATISTHNNAKDCWLLINSKVYNVTSFISAHPGGAGTIIPYCGQEATQAFNTKGGNTPHSSTAASMLSSYYIGDLNQATSQQQVQQSVQTTNAVAPTTRDGEDDDD
ncbi:MAG: cytochrome b5-like heme/steroid binding domain-containing protein [Patescibacteria group bacterium]